MGFRAARTALIRALLAGDYQHEAREALAEKNLLAVGDVTAAEVIAFLRSTRGSQYSSASHDWDRDTIVHVFWPVVSGQRWYVKAYFLAEADGTAVFISVHR
jgi:hypothetical protein